jgi:hypothetical protein
MKYLITDASGYIYGKFPNKICAELALKSMSNMLDNLIIKELTVIAE